MSFFDEIFNELNIGDCNENITISLAVNYGLSVVGKFKILSFNDSQISINSKNEKVVILGEDLKIKTMAKGEILVAGKILNIEVSYKKWQVKFL